MAAYMFKSRGGAIFFVGITLLGAAQLVGAEEDEGALLQAANQIQNQRDALDEEIAGFQRPSDGSNDLSFEEPDGVFADEAELIDDAAGFDPTPDAGVTDAELPEEGQVVIVDRESGEIVQQ